MKIAFCISGHIRNYKQLSKNYLDFKNHCQKYGQVDVFIATWNKQNTSNCWSGMHGLSADNSDQILVDELDVKNNFQATSISISDYDFYASQYSPLQYKYFNNNTYNWHTNGEHNGVVHSSKMMFLIYQANLLKLQQEYINNTSYDWVFRLRPDMLFDLSVCEHTLRLAELDQTKIYLYDYATGAEATLPGINDQFALGPSYLMNKYSNAFMRLCKAFDSNIFGHPEAVFANAVIDLIDYDNIVKIPRCGYLVAEKENSHIPYR